MNKKLILLPWKHYIGVHTIKWYTREYLFPMSSDIVDSFAALIQTDKNDRMKWVFFVKEYSNIGYHQSEPFTTLEECQEEADYKLVEYGFDLTVHKSILIMK